MMARRRGEAGIRTHALVPLVGLVAAGCYLSHPPADATSDDGGRDASAPRADGSSPTLDAGREPRILSIAAGGHHTCAVSDDGEVWCWGDNGSQQLAAEVGGASSVPVRAMGVPEAVQVAAGESHSCARLAGGSVVCWGRIAAAGFTAPRPATIEGVTDATDLACGFAFCCAALASGQASCWGFNIDGQLGDGTTESRHGGVPVIGVGDAVAVSAGASHACALRASGHIACWGSNREARLGNGMGGDDPVPVPVEVRHIDDAVSVAAGGNHTCAVRSSGELWCWGFNRQGQAGRAGSLEQVNDPGSVASVTEAVVAAAGPGHTCFLRRDHSVRCFGDNQWGALGNGSEYSTHVPVEPTGDPRGTGLALSQQTGGVHGHTCLILEDGGASCWGANDRGQLGDGTSASSRTPSRVTGFH